MTAYHSVEGDTHAPNIALWTKVLVYDDLWRHELRSPHAESRGDIASLLHVDRKAEVADLG